MFMQAQSSNNVALAVTQPSDLANDKRKQSPMLEGTSRLVAEMYAARKADECGIPQTIFKNEWTSGWWHTNPFASSLRTSEVVITILPARYFK